jgi:hypothetical protein
VAVACPHLRLQEAAQTAELEAAELPAELIAWHRPVVVAPEMARPSAEVALRAGPGAWAERASALPLGEPVARDAPAGPLQEAEAEAEVWVAGAAQSVAPHAAEELQQEAAAQVVTVLVAGEPVARRAAEGPQPAVEALVVAAQRPVVGAWAGEVARRQEAPDEAVPVAALPSGVVPWAFHRDRLRRPGPVPPAAARFARAMLLLKIAWP